MDTTAHTRRFRLTPGRVFAAGLVALTGGGLALGQYPAASSGPAARLKPPQVLDEPAHRVVGRGAAPEGNPATVSVYPTGSTPTPATRPPLFGSPIPTRAEPIPATPREPGVIESAWIDLKSLVTGGQPANPTPPFYHPQSGSPVRQQMPRQPQPMPQPRSQPQPTAARPAPGTMYAGPPAYRWYGWGTTTPGANAYAPTGQYPRGSATWYAQTGATPGAFPVPVMNPYRPEPSAAPPAYARGAAPDYPPMPAAKPTRGIATQDAPPELHYGPAPATTPVSTPVPMTTVPLPPGPPPATVERADGPPVIAQTGTNPGGLIQASGRSEPRAENGLIWQRSGESAPFVSPPPTVTVTRGMEPKAKEPTLDQLVRSACHGHAAVTEVRQTGPTQLLVRVRATTSADARAAFAALSEVPTLKPYKVEFEADIK